MPERDEADRQSGFLGITRRVLERQKMQDGDRELVVEEVTYPSGGVAPVHRHSVGGLVYIVEGIVESAYGDDQPQQYRAGETLRDEADRLHMIFRNCDPERPLRFLAIYVLEPGGSYVTDV